MIEKDGNISGCACLVHDILKKLLKTPVDKDKIAPRLSNDDFTLYINALRNHECKIKKPNQYSKKYQLSEGISLIEFDKKELAFLSDIKETLADRGNYTDIYNFNKVLLSLKPFVSKILFKDLTKIINSTPLGLKEYTFIEEIEYCIKNKNTLKISYLSPNSGENTYIINPIVLVIENRKLYLWCVSTDNENIKVRYLRVDRIINLQRLKKRKKSSLKFKKVFCEVKTGNLDFDDSFKIVATNGKYCFIEFDFVSEFHLLQKISSFNANCRIIRPKDMAIKHKKLLEDIIHEYEKEF